MHRQKETCHHIDIPKVGRYEIKISWESRILKDFKWTMFPFQAVRRQFLGFWCKEDEGATNSSGVKPQ